MQPTDQSQARAQLAEREYLAATLATEQQWLAKLHRAAQDELDRPNLVSRGRLQRLLAAIEQRRGRVPSNPAMKQRPVGEV